KDVEALAQQIDDNEAKLAAGVESAGEVWVKPPPSEDGIRDEFSRGADEDAGPIEEDLSTRQIPETRLPAEGKGHWEGEEGNGWFYPNDPAILKYTGNEPIYFEDFVPDLSPWKVNDEASVTLDALVGNDADFGPADREFASKM